MKQERKTITAQVGAEPRMAAKWWGGADDVLTYSGGESLDANYTSLNEALSKLTRIKEKYSCEYQNMRFRSVRDCGCSCDCSCTPTLQIVGDRLPTKLEKTYFDEQERKTQEAREQYERRQFEALKQKFEGEK